MRELPGHQQGDLYFEHRVGRITASRMNDLMAYSTQKGKEGKELQKRINYRFELLAERLTRRMQNHYVSPAMEYGIEAETEAKQAFELATGEMLIPVGFILHPDYDWTGASPDSLLTDAIYEAKNPESTTFLEWYFNKDVPEEHRDQMLWQMRCAEKSHGYFHARDVRQPEKIRNIIRILDRDSDRITQLEAEAEKMNAEIEAMITELGLPPTVWDTTGNPVIHHMAPDIESEMMITAQEIDAIIERERGWHA